MAELCFPVLRDSALGRLLAAQDLLPVGFRLSRPEGETDEDGGNASDEPEEERA